MDDHENIISLAYSDPPPLLGIFNAPQISMSESEHYDQWGNLKGAPIKTIDEYHGESFIKIFIYQYLSIVSAASGRTADYFFGFQLKLGQLIRQKRANIADRPIRSIDEARVAARNMIVDICRKNKATKSIFAEFTIIRYNQPELFQ